METKSLNRDIYQALFLTEHLAAGCCGYLLVQLDTFHITGDGGTVEHDHNDWKIMENRWDLGILGTIRHKNLGLGPWTASPAPGDQTCQASTRQKAVSFLHSVTAGLANGTW